LERACAFLREERQLGALGKASEQSWSGRTDDPVEQAINVVLEATGEAILWLHHGQLSADVDVIERVMRRAGLNG
jgi:hypothetical protein